VRDFSILHWQPWLQNISARAQNFAWQFWREKSEVRFRKNTAVMPKKQYVSQRLAPYFEPKMF